MTAPPTRRWFRFAFGLRTLFIVVTIFGIWLGWNLKIVRERKAVLEEIHRVDMTAPFVVRVLFPGLPGEEDYHRISLVRRALGDESYPSLDIPQSLEPEWIARAEQAFPEAELRYLVDTDSFELDQFRDSLYAPQSLRQPNVGTIFKTGLIEK